VKKVLLPQKIHEDGLKVLQGQVEIIIAPDPSKDTVSRYIQDVDGVVLRTTSRITRDMILSAPKLKVISRTGVGVDNIDVRTATERGVIVCNLPGFNNVSVAEHTTALILSLAKAINFLDNETRAANWSSRNSQRMTQLKGKTLGVIGFGAIGSSVANIMLNGFGMKVLAYDPYLEKSLGHSDTCVFCSLEQLMSQADVVSVHLPATPETVGLLDERLLGMLRPTALLVNTSRGNVVSEEALIALLQAKRIAGAGLDVFAVEPLTKDHPFLKLDNVVLTPHAAALTRECIVGAAVEAAKAVIDVLNGVPPRHIYNPDVIPKRQMSA
jgi:D-3-phosphoglycerate dehydrogenase / 2-oxoglutarate reductase